MQNLLLISILLITTHPIISQKPGTTTHGCVFQDSYGFCQNCLSGYFLRYGSCCRDHCINCSRADSSCSQCANGFTPNGQYCRAKTNQTADLLVSFCCLGCCIAIIALASRACSKGGNSDNDPNYVPAPDQHPNNFNPAPEGIYNNEGVTLKPTQPGPNGTFGEGNMNYPVNP